VLDTLVHEYCGYIRNNPDTLLTKFLGSYCITMYDPPYQSQTPLRRPISFQGDCVCIESCA